MFTGSLPAKGRTAILPQKNKLNFIDMKTQSQVPNLRVIKAKFTFQNGVNRVKLFETQRYNDDKTESKVFSYDSDIDNVLDQAIAVLERNGMNVICRGSEKDHYYILCDNWGPEFKKVTELK